MLPIRFRTTSPSIFDLEDFFNDFLTINTDNSLSKVPIHDVIETDKEFIVETMLAGVKKEDINVDIENDVLTIKAERKEVKDLKYNRKESFFGKYERSFKLPEGIDRENIQASLEEGMLKLVVPKLGDSEKLSKKSIEIK